MNHSNYVRTVFETSGPDETYNIAKELADRIAPGTVICLDGDLGVGKTVFAQGLAAGLGIMEPVNSPTFTILQVYDEGRMPLYHFDVYRVAEPEEMYEIGYEDCFFGEGVSLVEWSVLIEELIPEDAVRVTIERDPSKGDDYRRLIFECPAL